MAGPPITPSEKTVLAIACSSRGTVSNISAWPFAIKPPPPRPCTMRPMISRVRLEARPHKIDASTNATSEKNKVALFAEPEPEPRRERNDDDVGDRVTGRDPADFGKRRAKIALHIGKRHVDDAHVDHLKQGREGRGEDDGPFEPSPVPPRAGRCRTGRWSASGPTSLRRSRLDPFRNSSTHVST